MWWVFALDFILFPLPLNKDVVIDLQLHGCIALNYIISVLPNILV